MKNLFILTNSFPFGNSEPFLKNEISVLANEFDLIVIIPDSVSNKEIKYKLPSNVKVQVYPKVIKSNLILRVINSVKLILKETFVARQKKFALQNIINNFFLLLDLQKKAAFIQDLFESNSLNYFYSFWFSNQATVLSILTEQKKIDGYFSRAHGFDLYETNLQENHIPFRKYQLENVKKVFTVSKFGCEYLKALYPNFAKKISYSRLGVVTHGRNPSFHKKPYTLVSVSNVVSVKRVRLILEILKHSKEEFQWIHFGDGNLFDELQMEVKVLKSENVKVKLMGRKSNVELMDFFLENHVSLFINVSISEGIPFSIMEAMSFGVPVLATDVGGTSEIVNEETGLLISSDFDPIEVASMIDENIKEWISISYRENAFKQWEANFNANINYKNFAHSIINFKF